MATLLSVTVGVGVVLLLLLALVSLVIAVSLVVGGSLHRSALAVRAARSRRRRT